MNVRLHHRRSSPPHSLSVFSSLSTFNFELSTSFSSTFQPSNLPAFQCFSAYPLSFHTLAHSFASTKNSTPLFSSDSTLFPKNTGGGGTPAAILSYISSLLLCTLPQIQSDKAAGIIDPTKFINAFVSDEDADTDTNTDEDTDLDSDEDSDVDSDSETPTEKEMETRLHSINTLDPSIPEPDPKKKPS